MGDRTTRTRHCWPWNSQAAHPRGTVTLYPAIPLLTQSNPVQSLYLCHLQKQGAEDYQDTEQAALGQVSSYSLLTRHLYP